MMKRNIYVGLGITLLLVVITGTLFFDGGYEESVIAKGNDYIIKIEQYRGDRGQFPESLEDIGIEVRLDGPIYYERRDSSRYILWFGTDLGESVIYDSDMKEWK